ncbi:MAG: type II toxin-antitoxin system Phd/YefM family antitoxin [Acidobacteriota bacterium]|nr:type II toxin-antitoxin system Phd/YefM family antitoxin [Acidobacteriota bacterium]
METIREDQKSLSSVLELAERDGEVRIQRTDGNVFVLKPEASKHSAFDVAGIDLGISSDEIVEFIRESRKQVLGNP